MSTPAELASILGGMFTEAQCTTALSLSHGDPDTAVSMLMDGSIPAGGGGGAGAAAAAGVWEYDDDRNGWCALAFLLSAFRSLPPLLLSPRHLVISSMKHDLVSLRIPSYLAGQHHAV